MGGFGEAVRRRVREARAALRAAHEADDAYAAAVAEDDLDDALRLAREHDVDPDAEAGTKPAPATDEGQGGA